jgi:uncharacterized RDD family membrane protein YckC
VDRTTNPYAAPRAALEDAPKPVLALASRRDRFAAAFVDGFLSMMASLMLALGGPAFALAFVGLGAWNLWTVHRYRASVGKRFVGLRVLRSDGAESSVARIVFLRWLPVAIVMTLPFLVVLALVDILFIFRSDRRCLHDLLADTVVVDA